MENFLEKSLNSSMNESVYGKKMKTDREIAMLVVGIGGNGAEAVLRIKNQVDKKFQNPLIEYLEIDTDKFTEQRTYETTDFASAEAEFCNISVRSLPEAISKADKAQKAGEECWKWFDGISQNYMNGTTRQLGRMSLFWNIDKIKKAIYLKIDKLTSYIPVRRLQVYVCSGISGGTGSGILLDMAYILRKIAKSKMPDVSVYGYLVMPDVDEARIGAGIGRTLLQANGYACLKEIDYYTRAETRYCQVFPNGLELDEQGRPFTNLHLLNAVDRFGNYMDYKKIWNTVAQTIVERLAEPSDIRSIYENLHSKSGYLALGSSEMKVPYTEFFIEFFNEIFEELGKGVLKNKPSEKQFNHSFTQDLWINEEARHSFFYREIEMQRPLLNIKFYEYDDVRQNKTPYKDVCNWIELFQKSVAEQEEVLTDSLGDKLKEFIKRNLWNVQTGPFYLRYYMKDENEYCLYHRLNSIQKQCIKTKRQYREEIKKLRADIKQSFANIAKASAFTRKKALKKHIEVLDAWCSKEEEAILNEKLIEVLGKLQNIAEQYYENILKPLTDRVTEASEIIQEEALYIRIRAMKDEGKRDDYIQSLKQIQDEKFEEVVQDADDAFLKYLSQNIHKWIGRDIDNVNKKTEMQDNVEKSLVQLANEWIDEFLNRDKIKGEEVFETYLTDQVLYLLRSSNVMYKENSDCKVIYKNIEHNVIIIPDNYYYIYRIVEKYIRENCVDNIHVTRSVLNRIAIIRLKELWSLSGNALLAEMRQSYEEIKAAAVSVGIDLQPECKDILFDDDIGTDSSGK